MKGRKRAVPKRVQLPKGRVFYPKYGGIRTENLPLNVRIEQTYKKRQGGRKGQKGPEIKSVLKKAFSFGKKR